MAPSPALRAAQALEALPAAARTLVLHQGARATVGAFSAASLAATGAPAGPGPVVAHLLLVLSALLLLLVARQDADRCRRWTRGSVLLDLAAFVAYSAVYSTVPGAGSLYPVLTLLAGPALLGWPGAALTGLVMGATASVRPQRDVMGEFLDPAQTWLLVLLLVVPVGVLAELLRATRARGRRAEAQFRAVFDHAAGAVALLARDGRVLRGNPALVRLLGQELRPGVPLWEQVDDPAPLRALLARVSADAPVVRGEVALRADDRRRLDVTASAVLSGDDVSEIVLQAEDVTDRHALQERLRHAATHDRLTGLHSAGSFHEQVAASLRDGGRPGLLFLDLDRFKLVNDSLGHSAGDALLVSAAQRLVRAVGTDGTVARLGGDEFAVLCPDGAAALPVAQRVVDVLRAPHLVAGAALTATGSVGIALHEPGATRETLMRDADTAMYEAKRAGGGGAILFTAGHRERAVREQQLDAALREALRRGGLGLHHQAIVDTDGVVRAVEALLRWPARPDVAPQEIVSAAEQNGLIGELGWWVLERAVQESTGWPDEVVLHVNVSPRQLDAAFAGRLAALLRARGRRPDRLCLEVTEAVTATGVDDLVAQLLALRALGVRLAVDDFGAGHASLTYLARLPVHEVKVDRSFVAGLPDDHRSAAILAGVVAMAGAHGAEVVVEGVETPAQDRAVKALGVRRFQGFLHHAPVPVDALCWHVPAQRDAVPAAG